MMFRKKRKPVAVCSPILLKNIISIMSGDSPPSERRELFEVHNNHGGGHGSSTVMVGTSTGNTTNITTQTDPSAQPLLPTQQQKEENKDKEDRDRDKDEDKDKEEGGGSSQRVDANKPQGGGSSSEGARKKDGAGGGGGGGDKGGSGGDKNSIVANGTTVAIGVGSGTDLMDGQIKPSSASATSGKTVNEVIEEEDCAVKCLYYTMQCCECTIT